jgi:PAS domain S-box-containing protein
MSIRLKLTSLFLAVVLIPTLLVAAISFQNYRSSLENTQLAALQHLTVYKTETIKTYFAGLTDNMKMAQTFYNIKKNLPLLTQFAQDPNNPEFLFAKKMLDEQLQPAEKSLALHDIMLVNPNGRVVYSTNPGHYAREFLKPLPDPDQKAFAEGKKGIYISDIFSWEENGARPEMLLTAPASNANGTFIGVIVFEIDLAPIYNIIHDTTGLGRTGETLIGRKERKSGNQAEFLNPLRHDPEAALKRKAAFGNPEAFSMQQAIQGKTGSGIAVDYRGKQVIAAWRYIPSLDWGLVAKIDTDEAFVDVKNLQQLVAIVLFLILIVAGLMAFSIARSIAKPIRKLSEDAEIIGRGNLDHKIGTSLKDEIGQLSRSFDKMVQNLKTTTASRDELNREITERKQVEAALREQQWLHKSVTDNATLALFIMDSRQHCTFMNPAAEQLTGFTLDEVQGRPLHDVIHHTRPDGSHYPLSECAIDQAFPKNDRKKGEEVFVHKDGHFYPVAFTASPLRDDSGHPVGTIIEVQDITERKRAEVAMQQSRHDLDRAQAVANTGSWRLDVQKNELVWSDENHRIFGIPRGTPLTYETFLAAVHPDDRSYVDQKWRAALNGEHYDIEHRIVVDSQSPGEQGRTTKWMRETAELEFDKDGNLLVGFGITQDITERKQMEEALRKSRDELEMRVQERTAQMTETVETLKKAEKTVKAERKRFEDVLEMMPAYAVLLTPDYHVAFANRTFRTWFGDDNGQKCYEFLFQRTEPCETCETYTVLKTNEPHQWEWIGPDGRNYDIYDYPFSDVDGSPLIMEIGVDVTAHKQAQKSLQTSEERYRSLTVATTQVVWTAAANGEVVGDLPSWREFTGQTVEEIQGWGWIKSLHPDDRERTAEIWSEAVRSRSLYETEYRMRRLDGEYRYVSVRGVPVLEQDGSIREWIGTCTDITERRRMEEELRKHRDHLEVLVEQRTSELASANKRMQNEIGDRIQAEKELARSNRDLEQFAYVASHDLQEPLRIVTSYVQLLQRRYQDRLDQDAGEFINYAVDGARRMHDLINDLLDYSRIGKRSKPLEPIDCNAALDRAVRNLEKTIKDNNAVVTHDPLPIVMADEQQFIQMFQNLIGNAVKFHGPEQPRVHVSAEKRETDWLFAVRDNGIGIAPEFRERIFVIFQRLHGRDKYPGTGIGLAICKKIVEHHGGHIWFDSEPGKGTQFYFTIPAK